MKHFINSRLIIIITPPVSEHQPTTWASFYFDLQLLVFMFPVGLYYCFRYPLQSICTSPRNISLCFYFARKHFFEDFWTVLLKLLFHQLLP